MLFTYPIAPFFVPSTEKPHSGTPRFSLDAMTWIQKKNVLLALFSTETASRNSVWKLWVACLNNDPLTWFIESSPKLLISELFHLSVQLNHKYLQMKSPWTYQLYVSSFFNRINSKLVNDFSWTFTTFIVDIWSSCLNQQNDYKLIYITPRKSKGLICTVNPNTFLKHRFSTKDLTNVCFRKIWHNQVL